MCEPTVSTCKHVSFSITAYNLHSKAGDNPEYCKTEWAKDCQNFKLTLCICVYKVKCVFFFNLVFSKVYRQVKS